MGQIYEPILDCVILIQTTTFGSPYKNEFEDRVNSIPELREYFKMFKRRGELFGYVVEKNRKLAGNDEKTIKVEVFIKYSDKTGEKKIGFDNVKMFVSFLDAYPAIANCLKYVKK
jgi:hypothetical protein